MFFGGFLSAKEFHVKTIVLPTTVYLPLCKRERSQPRISDTRIDDEAFIDQIPNPFVSLVKLNWATPDPSFMIWTYMNHEILIGSGSRIIKKAYIIINLSFHNWVIIPKKKYSKEPAVLVLICWFLEGDLATKMVELQNTHPENQHVPWNFVIRRLPSLLQWPLFTGHVSFNRGCMYVPRVSR